jgi:hypothetical protein
MNKQAEYAAALHQLADWAPYLLAESRLPGPRANLELLHVVAALGSAAQFEAWLADDVKAVPFNVPEEFLTLCALVGLGRLVAEGETLRLAVLRRYAGDARWRPREAVAMALQRVGDAGMAGLLQTMDEWSHGSWLEQRAVVAALAEPRLLRDASVVAQVLVLFDRITADLAAATERRTEAYKTLRQALGYGWSVVVAAQPAIGKPVFERWCEVDAPDVRWILRENLKKKRLAVMDQAWVVRCLARLF